ncbi:MAG: HD domain protein [Candidatus Nomurabacteria bacterium GW2011_GWB1_37_5]|uniref:HD domain protein n=1 Tax=Candidatus Nomurabacteria bacterium GW2011_GWB1_37_5 TaxID=1618742 RepID=A0A0G0K1G5_9BACT|nr:MAG: HD domain protein [Candidatus Nomurabacteria bacterium GW2011_GWB1_37_5]
MKKILVIDDDKMVQLPFKRILGDKYNVLQAYNLKEAAELFQNNPDVDLIVMDGCLSDKGLDTLPLIEEIRKTFKGTMIASSSRVDYRATMVEKGCSYPMQKWEILEKIHQILE